MGQARSLTLDHAIVAPEERPALPQKHVDAHGTASTEPTLNAEQLDLLLLIANGKGNEEIAVLRNLKPLTVQFKVSAIMDATGCATRSACVAYAFRKGLIK